MAAAVAAGGGAITGFRRRTEPERLADACVDGHARRAVAEVAGNYCLSGQRYEVEDAPRCAAHVDGRALGSGVRRAVVEDVVAVEIGSGGDVEGASRAIDHVGAEADVPLSGKRGDDGN